MKFARDRSGDPVSSNSAEQTSANSRERTPDDDTVTKSRSSSLTDQNPAVHELKLFNMFSKFNFFSCVRQLYQQNFFDGLRL